MEEYTLRNEEIESYNGNTHSDFPKYTSQLINNANQNAQGPRPRVVGQMSDLFEEFRESGMEITVENWRKWYNEKCPNALENATEKILEQVQKQKEAIQLINRDLIKQWVEDLIFSKTYNGLYVQKAILASLAKRNNTEYRLANPDEESKGIDGYVGTTPYSIKPMTSLVSR